MGLFNFMLRPTEAIQPWEEPGRRTLSWFGLSDGWYWLELAGQELYRLLEPARSDEPPYVGYQVVRLWEDVLEILPAVLAPVPADLAPLLRTPERFLAEVERMQANASKEDPEDTRVSEGLAFWYARYLSSDHLVAAPDVWLWRDGEAAHALWRSDPRGAELWQPVAGRVTMPLDQLVREVRAFDRAFLAAMGERVQALLGDGGLPGVEIDLEHLVFEQRDRATWLDHALSRTRDEDWEPARSLFARYPA